MVEQLMTTGGGWQDQVNGLLPGFKIGICEASESQVKVDAVQLDTSEDFCRTFESHLVLVYTGKVRLAKNLLQVGPVFLI